MVPMLDTLEVLYLSKNNRLTTCTVRRSINTGQLAATEPIQTNLFIFQSQPDCGRSGRTEMDKLVVSKAQHKESDDLEESSLGTSTHRCHPNFPGAYWTCPRTPEFLHGARSNT